MTILLLYLFFSLASCTKRAFEDISSADVPIFKNYSELPSKQAVLAELEEQIRPLFPEGLPNVEHDIEENIRHMRNLLNKPEWNPILARWIWLKGLGLFEESRWFVDHEVEMNFFQRSLQKGSANLLKDMIDYSPKLTSRMHFLIQLGLGNFSLRPFYSHYPVDLLEAMDQRRYQCTPYPAHFQWFDTESIFPLLSDYPVGHPHIPKDLSGPIGVDPISVAIYLYSHFVTRPHALPLDKLRCWESIRFPESMRILAGVVKTFKLPAEQVEKLLPARVKPLWPSFLNPEVPPNRKVIFDLLGVYMNYLGVNLDGNISRFAIRPAYYLGLEVVHWLLNSNHRTWFLDDVKLYTDTILIQTATVYPEDAKLIPWPDEMPPIRNLVPYTSHQTQYYPTKLAPYFIELIKQYEREPLEKALVGHPNERMLVSILRVLDPNYCKGSVAKARAEVAFWTDVDLQGKWIYEFLSLNDPVRWVDSLKQLLSEETSHKKVTSQKPDQETLPEA